MNDINTNGVTGARHPPGTAKRGRIGLRKRFRILRRYGFRCFYCGKSALKVELEMDHLLAVARGGTDEETNLVPACFKCNRGKAAGPSLTRYYFHGDVSEQDPGLIFCHKCDAMEPRSHFTPEQHAAFSTDTDYERFAWHRNLTERIAAPSTPSGVCHECRQVDGNYAILGLGDAHEPLIRCPNDPDQSDPNAP